MHPSRIYRHTDDLDMMCELDSGLVCALFCRLYQPISLSRSPRQGIRAWFSAQSGTADQVISLRFPP